MPDKVDWVAAIQAIPRDEAHDRLHLKSPQFVAAGWCICPEHQRNFRWVVLRWAQPDHPPPRPELPLPARKCPLSEQQRKGWLYRVPLRPEQLVEYVAQVLGDNQDFGTSPMVQAWKIAPGEGAEDWDLFRENGCIGIGWLPDSDYRDYGSKAEVLAALEQKHGKGAQGNGKGDARTIWRFVHDVKQHHVVVANDGLNGIVGIGVVDSEYLPPKSAQNPIPNDATKRRHVRRVNWRITDPVDLPIDPLSKQFGQGALQQLGNEKLDSIRQAYATKYPHLEATLDEMLVGHQAGISGLLPEEVVETPALFEGAICKITVNAYERNRRARQQCIAAHGTTCFCGFNFGAVYGPEAEGYIHVHHLRPLSEVDGEYVVDPIEDLRPVCPNCHAILHLGGNCRSIDEVRKMIEDHRS